MNKKKIVFIFFASLFIYLLWQYKIHCHIKISTPPYILFYDIAEELQTILNEYFKNKRTYIQDNVEYKDTDNYEIAIKKLKKILPKIEKNIEYYESQIK